jgi:hypothetical protein
MNDIMKFLKREPLLYADVADGVKRGIVRALYVSETALLAVNDAGFYLLCSTDLQGAGMALNHLPLRKGEKNMLVAHGNAAREAVLKNCRVLRETKCHQCVYLGEALPLRGDLAFFLPDDESVRKMQAVYALESPETIAKMAKSGQILAAYLPLEDGNTARGDFVGFIGSHADGSMGMLHVFETHRRHGYAEEIESAQINHFLKEGRLPFGHVIEGNEASYRLQQKLGLRFADEYVTWMLLEEAV